jgi:hypothetical protein
MACQLAAYRQLYVEDSGSEARIGGLIIGLPRTGEGFTMHHITPETLDHGWDMFLQIKEMRDQESVIKSLTKKGNRI